MAQNLTRLLVAQAKLRLNIVTSIGRTSTVIIKRARRWSAASSVGRSNNVSVSTSSPFHHQVTNLITFCRRLPVTLLADDVGLGKTISAGLVASELIARSRVSKILIVCPKILGQQWRDELKIKFDIPAEIAIGRD
jgi:SNF2 family DNA or RNA helicase